MLGYPRKMLRTKRRILKLRTRSSADPYSTEELSDIVEQVHAGFQTILQFMKEISVFVDFEAGEFVAELQDTVNELDKHF